MTRPKESGPMNFATSHIMNLALITLSLICTLGFLLQCRDTMIKFVSGKTAKATRSVKAERGLSMPAVSICVDPWIHRSRVMANGYDPDKIWSFYRMQHHDGNLTRVEMDAIWPRNETLRIWRESTFDFEEIVQKVEVFSTAETKHQVQVNVTAINTKYSGRCYVMTIPPEAELPAGIGLNFDLKVPWNENSGYEDLKQDLHYAVFVHQRHDEFNLVSQTWHNDPFMARVKPNTFADIALKKTVNVDKTKDSCSHYDSPILDWLKCFNGYLQRETKDLNCTVMNSQIIDWKLVSQKPVCGDGFHAAQVLLTESFARMKKSEEMFRVCPAICDFEKETYDGVARTGTLHGETDLTKVYVYYSDIVTNYEETILLYDFNGIVSAVGGSLGLFLGFSCLDLGKAIMAKLSLYR